MSLITFVSDECCSASIIQRRHEIVIRQSIRGKLYIIEDWDEGCKTTWSGKVMTSNKAAGKLLMN